MKTLLLSKNDVEQVLNFKDVIEAVEDGYRTMQKGVLQIPDIVSVTMPAHDGESDLHCVLWMAVCLQVCAPVRQAQYLLSIWREKILKQ